MTRVIIIALLISTILSCGKKGSLEFPTDGSDSALLHVKNTFYS